MKLKNILIVVAFYSFSCCVCLPAAASDTIGVLMVRDFPYHQEIQEHFEEELKKIVMDSNGVEILIQRPEPNKMAWRNATRRFVVLDVDIVVIYGETATRVAMSETAEIPVVFSGSFSPSSTVGKVKNLTGISYQVPIDKLITSFKRITDFSRLGVVYCEHDPESMRQVNKIKSYGNEFGYEPILFDISNGADNIDTINIDAALLIDGCMVWRSIDSIMDTIRAAKVPSAAFIGGAAEKGVILTLAANPADIGKDMARKVADLLNSKKPSVIPVTVTIKTEMTLNLKAAQELGLNIPFDLFGVATKVLR